MFGVYTYLFRIDWLHAVDLAMGNGQNDSVHVDDNFDADYDVDVFVGCEI